LYITSLLWLKTNNAAFLKDAPVYALYIELCNHQFNWKHFGGT